MKYLLITLLLISCAKTEVNPKNTSIAGNWAFSSKTLSISGQFTLGVSPTGDVSVTNGTFILSGKTYLASPFPVASSAPLTFDTIWLNDLAESTSVGIQSVTYPADFTSMIGLKLNYFIKNGTMNTITETIAISRK